MSITEEEMKTFEGHTPGPWAYSCGAVYEDKLRGAYGYPTNCLLKADRDNGSTDPCERDANCKLAAAAPAILTALIEARRQRDKLAEALGACTNALEKSQQIINNEKGDRYSAQQTANVQAHTNAHAALEEVAE